MSSSAAPFNAARFRFFQYSMLTDPSTVTNYVNSTFNHSDLVDSDGNPMKWDERRTGSSNPLIAVPERALRSPHFPLAQWQDRTELRREQNRQYTSSRLADVVSALNNLHNNTPTTTTSAVPASTKSVILTSHSLLTECLSLRSWESLIDRLVYPPIVPDDAFTSAVFRDDLGHCLDVLHYLSYLLRLTATQVIFGASSATKVADKPDKPSVFAFITSMDCSVKPSSKVLKVYCGGQWEGGKKKKGKERMGEKADIADAVAKYARELYGNGLASVTKRGTEQRVEIGTEQCEKVEVLAEAEKRDAVGAPPVYDMLGDDASADGGRSTKSERKSKRRKKEKTKK
jgi:hypothetical protein